MFGVVSLLINVANVMCCAAGPAGERHARRDIDFEDCDQIVVCPPVVDVLEEEDELLVLMEIPGCYAEKFSFNICEDVLTLMDEDDRECHEILLPDGYELDHPASVCFNNGVITIRYQKIAAPLAASA